MWLAHGGLGSCKEQIGRELYRPTASVATAVQASMISEGRMPAGPSWVCLRNHRAAWQIFGKTWLGRV